MENEFSAATQLFSTNQIELASCSAADAKAFENLPNVDACM